MMDLSEELQGLAAANALVHAVLVARFDRLGVVSVDQVKTVVQGALDELPGDEGGSLDAAGFMMETLLELLEETDRDGGTPARGGAEVDSRGAGRRAVVLEFIQRFVTPLSLLGCVPEPAVTVAVPRPCSLAADWHRASGSTADTKPFRIITQYSCTPSASRTPKPRPLPAIITPCPSELNHFFNRFPLTAIFATAIVQHQAVMVRTEIY